MGQIAAVTECSYNHRHQLQQWANILRETGRTLNMYLCNCNCNGNSFGCSCKCNRFFRLSTERERGGRGEKIDRQCTHGSLKVIHLTKRLSRLSCLPGLTLLTYFYTLYKQSKM